MRPSVRKVGGSGNPPTAGGVRSLRERDIEFAAVWHVEAGVEAWDWRPFYPGDAYVDWIGTSLFWREHFAEATSANYISQQAVIEFAEARKKPVLIAESSPNEHGVAINPGQDVSENTPERLHTCPSDATIAGTAAWNKWFAPYFSYIEVNKSIKGFSYINNDWSQAEYNDWKKDARIGENTFVAGKFQEEMRDGKYRHLSAVEDELGGCKAHIIRVDGADWLRFLPTGDMALSEGSLHANAPYDHDEPPVFAIVNELGQPLLAIPPEVGASHVDNNKIGNVYLRGNIFEEAGTISPPTEAHWRYQDENNTVLALLDAQGNLRLRGESMPSGGEVPRETRGDWPNNNLYHGFGCRPEDPKAPEADCDCFRETVWYGGQVCDYPSSTKAPPNIQSWITETDLLQLDEYGNVYITRGAIYTEGESLPQGLTGQEFVLVECDSEVKAKLVVEVDNGLEYAHLWLADRVIVARTPSPGPHPTCWNAFTTVSDETLATIDDNGLLTLRGLLYVEDAIHREVYNWPFSTGGSLIYE